MIQLNSDLICKFSLVNKTATHREKLIDWLIDYFAQNEKKMVQMNHSVSASWQLQCESVSKFVAISIYEEEINSIYSFLLEKNLESHSLKESFFRDFWFNQSNLFFYAKNAIFHKATFLSFYLESLLYHWTNSILSIKLKIGHCTNKNGLLKWPRQQHNV